MCICVHLDDTPMTIAFVLCRYYCSKPCQVSDWPRHKEYHKSLGYSRGKHGHVVQSKIGSLMFCEGEVSTVTEPGSVSDEEKDSNGMTALLRAASAENCREVRKLILGGADPMVADCQGMTALHYAAHFGNTELVRTLIEHGPGGLLFCDAPGGETSLFIACAEAS